MNAKEIAMPFPRQTDRWPAARAVPGAGSLAAILLLIAGISL